MNAKMSVFVICVESIIYLSLYNLHDCTFNAPDHVFHTNVIAYCQQNRYIRLATYTDLLTLIGV